MIVHPKARENTCEIDMKELLKKETVERVRGLTPFISGNRCVSTCG
jgi:hypothetical protein